MNNELYQNKCLNHLVNFHGLKTELNRGDVNKLTDITGKFMVQI